jgi:transposase
MNAMIGIDTSKSKLDYSLVLRDKLAAQWQRKTPNCPEGYTKLLQDTPPDTPWVIEPTGRYSLGVVQFAVETGQKILLAPPARAKAFLNSLQSRAKTDKIDAKGLAMFGLSRQLFEYTLKEGTVDLADQLLSARRGLSSAITRLTLQRQQLPLAQAPLQATITAVKLEMKKLDKQIAEHTKTSPRLESARRIEAVPGIGKITAAAVASRLSGKSFSHPDKFVAYIGLDTRVAESGKRTGRRHISHEGDAELRRLLYVCAQATLRSKNSPFKVQYERERKKGLPSTAALCAVARKMARLCWSLHKHGTTYDPARVGVQLPPSPTTIERISEAQQQE